MTPSQLKMARHALGLVDGRKVSYRNHYVAWLGGGDEAGWNDLCGQGFAERGKDRTTGVVGFCLTEAGARAALRTGETLDPEDFPDGAVAPAQCNTGAD